MSGFLLILFIDWVLRNTMEGQRRGIRWDFTRLMLEDIDCADDLLLLKSRADDLQEKTAWQEEHTGRIGLKLNSQKGEKMKVKSRNSKELSLDDSHKCCKILHRKPKLQTFV